ncbi:hypothetical protein ACROYT_G025185 [Oculina patagonica]
MLSIVTAVLQFTIGLLVKKERDKAAEKLKDGDVTDQIFCEFIVREIDDIKSKLYALSEKDLAASLSFFKEGIRLLYCDVFDKARSRSKYGAVATQAACTEEFSLTKGIRTLELSELDESAAKAFYNAKGRFKKAREKATEAFNNTGLKLSDRILAMQFRVVATVLEDIDNPAVALTPCTVCIEELNSLETVRKCFDSQLKEGQGKVRDLFKFLGKAERKEIIFSVCQVYRYVYDVTQTASNKEAHLWIWPAVDTEEGKVDPLRDGRVTSVLRELGMEHCCVSWTFGQEGEEDHKLKVPCGIATTSNGDNVYTLDVLDVATDMNDNIYVLVTLEKPGARDDPFVYEFNSTAGLRHKFPVRGGWILTVTDSGKVLVLRCNVVDVYETDRQFVRSFGEDILKDARDITAASDGRVMVVDRDDSCVHIFSERGDHLHKFKLQGCYRYPRIACHRASECFVVVSLERRKDLLQVEAYTKNGEFVRNTLIPNERIGELHGMAVTTEGRIAVACGELHYYPGKVLVI